MSAETRKGKVKFYLDEKLYGFIIDEETNEEIYVPVAGLIDEIRNNDLVTYQKTEGKTGIEAIEVQTRKK